MIVKRGGTKGGGGGSSKITIVYGRGHSVVSAFYGGHYERGGSLRGKRLESRGLYKEKVYMCREALRNDFHKGRWWVLCGGERWRLVDEGDFFGGGGWGPPRPWL